MLVGTFSLCKMVNFCHQKKILAQNWIFIYFSYQTGIGFGHIL